VTAPSIETARGWLGRVMVDHDSNRIGEITAIYLDNETGRPEWVVVRTGLFGMRSTFVPLAEAAEVGGQLQVPYRRLQVKEAPNIAPDGHLSAAEEAELYRHYGLDYDTVPVDDGSPADGAPTSATGEPEGAGPLEGDRAEAETHGTEPGTDEPESLESAGQDPSPVGAAVSRPFVYETPGPPQGGASGGRRQPGQVRLRRYLVTEVVTDTESGQRHEVQVLPEPIADAEVDATTTTPGRLGEPTGEQPPGPDDNDWFSEARDPRR